MNRVAIVAGLRTAFVKAGGVFSSYEAVDLLAHVFKASWDKFNLAKNGLDEVIAGSVLHDPAIPNIAREAIFKAGLPGNVVGHAVSNNCITGLVAVNFAAESIALGRISSALAGGAEAMSRPSLTFNNKAKNLFLSLSHARTLGKKLSVISKFRPAHFSPRIPSPKEPSTGLTMGEHCEMMVKEFGIKRESQDEIAFRSHQNAARAQKDGFFDDEIVALDGVDKDNIIRGNTTLEKLSSLPPVFDKTSSGTLTAGNSSALTDGASVVLLMSEQKAKDLGLKPLGFLEASSFSALNPQDGLLMGPAIAVPSLMSRLNISISDVDIFEIHEAFSGQVLCNISAWENGWSKSPNIKPIGKIPENKINLNGGSLAMGHPFAATGGRLILSALKTLHQQKAKRAVISVCAAGGMGAAMSVTRD